MLGQCGTFRNDTLHVLAATNAESILRARPARRQRHHANIEWGSRFSSRILASFAGRITGRQAKPATTTSVSIDLLDTPDGETSVMAGAGEAGDQDGDGASASFGLPSGLA
jgi:hypothetical protein